MYGYQFGGKVPAPTLEDIAPFKEAQQLYMEGDPKLESGASMFAPSGGYSKDYFAGQFDIPVEETSIDTAYYQDPQNYMFNVMRGEEKVGETSARGNISPRRSEYMGAKRELEGGLKEKLGSRGYGGILGDLMRDDYSGLEEKIGGGYFDMDPFEQMRYESSRRKGYQQGGEVYQGLPYEPIEADFEPQVNPFTGEAVDSAEDKKRLVMSMLKSLGVGKGQSIDSDAMDSLMGMSDVRRIISPLKPDEYIMRQENGDMFMSRQQVPKLSAAYMASFGMETPLSKRQRSLLQSRALNPESMGSQLHGLLGKVLLRRFENEPR